MSGLVLNENTIDPTTIKTEQIKVERIKYVNLGARVWFALMASDRIMYQRWSMNMDSTDETLLLVNNGDSIEIQYVVDKAEDLVALTFKPFERNIILNAKFIE